MVLGKALPFLDQLMNQFDLSLAGAGWLTSGVTAVAAVAAAPFGRWAGVHEPRRLLIISLIVLGVAGLGSALAVHTSMVLAFRLVEGVGFLGIVVVGPSLLGLLVESQTRRRSALAWWGACIPIGLSLAAAAGGLSRWLDWRGWFATVGLLCLGVAAVVFLALPTLRPATRTVTTVKAAGGNRLRTWLLAVGFMLVSAMGVAVLAVLPAFLEEERGLSLGHVGLVTSVIAAASAAGSALASALFHLGARPYSLLPAALVIPVAAFGVFRTAWPVPGTVCAGIALLLVNGLAVSALFATLPTVADTAGLAAANGLLTQLGSVGTLLGPPAMGAAVDRFGWGSPVLLLAAAVAGGVVCGVAAARPAARGGYIGGK